jgi:DNA-binding transcriptional ArsR family regulator
MTSNVEPALPPGIQLYRMAIGHYISRALHLFAKLEIADLLAEGPRSAEDLAAATGTHASSLRRVLRLLASSGVVEELEDGRFALTELGKPLISGPGSSRWPVMLFAGPGIQDSWKELEYCVRTGQPWFRKQSPDADAFSTMEPEMVEVFDRAMATFAPQSAAAIAATYDFSSVGTLVDVGGGNGAILRGILDAHPHLQGIVFDRPEVVERAEELISEAGLSSRCRVAGGDFFREVPSGGDAYLLKHVIHDWNDEQAAVILRNCRGAMGPGGRLLIAEGLYPDRVDQSLAVKGATANDVNMLVVTGGRQRSEPEFKSLYEASGFTLTRILPTPAGLSLIEGVPH